MAVTLVDLNFTLSDLIGANFNPRRTRVWIESNVEGDVIIDAAGNAIHLGNGLPDAQTDGYIGPTGIGKFTGLVATNSTTNPTAFQYRVTVEYDKNLPAQTAGGGKSRWDSGWFSLTATSDLADVTAEQYVPPTFMTTATTTLQGYVDQGKAYRDNQALIAGLTGEDSAVSALINQAGPTPAESATHAALSASYVPRASDALTSVKVGTSALGAATTGAFNVAVGDSALAANTTGQLNTAVGAFAATSGTTATQNTAVGTNALRLNTTGVDNVAVGFNCLRSQTDAAGNTGVGSAAGYSLTTGRSNVAVGANSLYAATVALENVAVGVNALRNTTGNNNVGIGVAALYSNTTGIENTAIGTSALNWATTAVHNTAAGVQAGFSATTGSQNVILGVNALYTLTTGGQNVAVGFGAGYTLTPANGVVASSGHTHIGQQSGLGVATDPSFTTTLGYRTLADAAGGVAIGVDSTGASAHSVAANEVALGTAAHTTRLAGYLQIDRGQATVGAAGAASALPATPTKYLSVKDSTGTEYVFPVYAKV